ncbi:MAG: ABC transporter permease [Bacteroidetes bacterium]|nr:ABC transporter permease [Bacteroidota bacterium]
MHQLLSAFRKEFLILIRDIPGLAILFIMPVLLIMIVTLAQQNALKSSKEIKTDVLFVDQSHSAFSRILHQNLDSSGLYHLISLRQGIPVNEPVARKMIGEGEFSVGIVVAAKDTAIRLLVDPSLQSSYKNTITGSLTYFIKGTQSRIAIENLLKTLAPSMASGIDGLIETNIRNMPPVQEIYATKENATIKPSIIQNNVPGFILFAMFFIVIPLSGSMVTEKMEGSFGRLRTLPVRVGVLLTSKVILFLGVCTLQFFLMLMVGIWVLPVFFGMPALQISTHFSVIIIATLCAALAATGFGLLVGAFASSQGQAALFGSVMVVILGVLSGTFLPVYLMPKAIQYISLISPIRWGIDNYLDIFIREGTLVTIFPNILRLLAFFILAMIVSIVIFARRK